MPIGFSQQKPPEDFECDDGNPCTVGDFCKGSGECQPLEFCNDDNACTVDSCQYVSLPNGDFDYAYCEYKPGVVCDDDNPCTQDSCTETEIELDDGTTITGVPECSHDVLESQDCDDGNPCTIGDSCSSNGVCLAGQLATSIPACAGGHYDPDAFVPDLPDPPDPLPYPIGPLPIGGNGSGFASVASQSVVFDAAHTTFTHDVVLDTVVIELRDPSSTHYLLITVSELQLGEQSDRSTTTGDSSILVEYYPHGDEYPDSVQASVDYQFDVLRFDGSIFIASFDATLVAADGLTTAVHDGILQIRY